MRRQLLAVCRLLVLGSFPLLAAAAAEGPEGGHGQPSVGWKWLNFAILAGGLGYLAVTKGGPALRLRGEQIRRGINEAAEAARQAEARAADIDRRLAGLEQEISALRAAAAGELAAEGERIRAQTAESLRKIQEHAEQEIASAARSARQQLREEAADLAVELAGQKVRARLTPPVREALVSSFAADLSRAVH